MRVSRVMSSERRMISYAHAKLENVMRARRATHARRRKSIVGEGGGNSQSKPLPLRHYDETSRIETSQKTSQLAVHRGRTPQVCKDPLG